jgi:capsular exopolysaccharide synthesis family protein
MKTIKKPLPLGYIVTRDEPLSFVSEAYQKLLATLEYTNVDGNHRLLHFTSPLPSEGKSTTIGNLSYLLSEKSKKVLVLDLDLRRPKIHRLFGLSNQHGIVNILSGETTFEETIHRLTPMLHVLTAGPIPSAFIHVLTSQKLKTLLSQWLDVYDYILVDSPPVIAVADALYIGGLAQGTLLLVNQQTTPMKAAMEAKKLLLHHHIHVLGVIFNQVKRATSSYYYNYRYDASTDGA